MTQGTRPAQGPNMVHPAAMSTSLALAMARADVREAVNADNGHRRTQYALSALDNAATVLHEPGSTALERTYAEYYFADAEAMIANVAEASLGVEYAWSGPRRY